MDDLEAWDAVADTYASAPRDDRFSPFLDRHVGTDLHGLRVLDLGCGHGWFAEVCRQRGAEVVGVDGSERQLTRHGVLVATITHPAFFLQKPIEDPDTGARYRKVAGYLEHDEWWITSFGGHRHYHRPLGSYVEWLASLGLGVIELFEPPVPNDGVTDYERWFATIPTMLGLAASHVASA